MSEHQIELYEEDLKTLEEIKESEEARTGYKLTMSDLISKIIQEEYKRLIK